MMKRLLAGYCLAAVIVTPVLAQDMPPPPPGGDMGGPPRGGPRMMTRADAERMADMGFAMIDANHNGVVTRAEFDAFREQRRAMMRERRGGRDDMGPGGPPPPDGAAPPPPPRGDMGPGGPPPPPDGAGISRGMRGGGGMMMGKAWFDMADADHDGRVTLAEAKSAAMAMFDHMDTNHDGVVSPEERRAAMEMMRGAPPPR